MYALAGCLQWLHKQDAQSSRRATGSSEHCSEAEAGACNGNSAADQGTHAEENGLAGRVPDPGEVPQQNGQGSGCGMSGGMQHVSSNGNTQPSTNYETMTFHVGGKELSFLTLHSQ